MVVSVPSHEMADYETQTIAEHLEEVTSLTESFVKDGGAYQTKGKGKGKTWVGIDPEPSQ